MQNVKFKSLNDFHILFVNCRASGKNVLIDFLAIFTVLKSLCFRPQRANICRNSDLLLSKYSKLVQLSKRKAVFSVTYYLFGKCEIC